MTSQHLYYHQPEEVIRWDDLNYGKAALKIFILGVNKEEDR